MEDKCGVLKLAANEAHEQIIPTTGKNQLSPEMARQKMDVRKVLDATAYTKN